jgi:hypothetical protein
MAETATIEREIAPHQFGSRFGDVEKIMEIMGSGEVVEMGSIDELFPEAVPPHQNRVEVVDLPLANRVGHINEVLGVTIQRGQDRIRCVFKPLDGESEETRRDTGVNHFYTRECAAFMVSEHFSFDIIPPTIIREINGRIGSIQLFLDPGYYQIASKLDEDIPRSDDFYKMAAIDWLLINCERKPDNVLVRKGNTDEQICIDHGIIMSGSVYIANTARGPARELTWKQKPLNEQRRGREEGEAIFVKVPENILKMVADALERREELTAKLAAITDENGKPILDIVEIEMMWERAKQILEKKVFISHYNYPQLFPDESFLAAYIRKERQMRTEGLIS